MTESLNMVQIRIYMTNKNRISKFTNVRNVFISYKMLGYKYEMSQIRAPVINPSVLL